MSIGCIRTVKIKEPVRAYTTEKIIKKGPAGAGGPSVAEGFYFKEPCCPASSSGSASSVSSAFASLRRLGLAWIGPRALHLPPIGP